VLIDAPATRPELCPGLAHRLRWATRLGPRGFAAYVAGNTVLLFGIRTWIIPAMKRTAAERERAADAEEETSLGAPPRFGAARRVHARVRGSARRPAR
jgi:hypothetical protein